MRLAGVVDLLGSYFDSVEGRYRSIEIDIPDVPRPNPDVSASRDLIDFINVTPRREGFSNGYTIVDGFKPYDFSGQKPASFEPTSRGNLQSAESQKKFRYDQASRQPRIGDLVEYRSSPNQAPDVFQVAEVVLDERGKIVQVRDPSGNEYGVSDLTTAPSKAGDIVRVGSEFYRLVDIRVEKGVEFFVGADLKTGENTRVKPEEAVTVDLSRVTYAFVNGQLVKLGRISGSGRNAVYGFVDPNTRATKGLAEVPAGSFELLRESDRIEGINFARGDTAFYQGRRVDIYYLSTSGKIIVYDQGRYVPLALNAKDFVYQVQEFKGYKRDAFVKYTGKAMAIEEVYSDGKIVLSNGNEVNVKQRPIPVEVPESASQRNQTVVLEDGSQATIKAVFNDGSAAVSRRVTNRYGEVATEAFIIERFDVMKGSECARLLERYSGR
jgi:hypothetical protein